MCTAICFTDCGIFLQGNEVTAERERKTETRVVDLADIKYSVAISPFGRGIILFQPENWNENWKKKKEISINLGQNFKDYFLSRPFDSLMELI